MSTLFVRTLRDDPADAELPSHRLLVRAGYVRRAGPGLYSWLPLGYRVLRNVERVVREEMEAIGAQEVHFPALLPREPYEASNRWSDYGDGIFRLKDRKDADYLLGPTHEEMFTLLVKDLCSSYKDLPLSLFQIQNKYRDEARPRAGLLRAREFVMKDSYSFDVSDDSFLSSYQSHREAYVRIFDRLGLTYVIVAAMSGAMGGSASEEFLAVAENGEDTYVRSPGGYAANVEAVRVPVPDPVPYDDVPAAHVEDTPDTPTIATLVALANERHPKPDRAWQASDTLKNVVVLLVHPDGRREPLAVGIPGDREVDLKRLQAQVEPAEVAPFADAEFDAHPGLVRGYIGPQALGAEAVTGIRYLVDPRVVTGTRWLTGANQPGKHVFDLVVGRDFTPDGVIEAAEVKPGDPAPDGSGPLELARGIEMGHIFQLGRRFAEALGLHGLLRRRGLARRGRHHRELPRRGGPDLAARGVPRRRAPGRHRQGPCRPGRGRADHHRAAGARRRSAAGRPAQGVTRSEVQGRRADRGAHHRDRRQGPRRRRRRGEGPAQWRTRAGAGRRRGPARRRGRAWLRTSRRSRRSSSTGAAP
jgi:prolyl-tRNA synthetase